MADIVINEPQNLLARVNPLIHATREIKNTYGDNVTIKPKTLRKFGQSRNVDADTTTEVQELQDAVVVETLLTANSIIRMVSTSTSDTTQTMVIEGATIDSAGLNFVAQEANLNGQNLVTLATPLARVTRAYVKRSGTIASPVAALAGDVAFYEASDLTSGKPNTDAAVHMLVKGTRGKNQSEKAMTFISKRDYLILTSAEFAMGRSTGTGRATVEIQTKGVFGGAWQPKFQGELTTAGTSFFETHFFPPIIVPPNSDIRIIARGAATQNDLVVKASFNGYFAEIQNRA